MENRKSSTNKNTDNNHELTLSDYFNMNSFIKDARKIPQVYDRALAKAALRERGIQMSENDFHNYLLIASAEDIWNGKPKPAYIKKVVKSSIETVVKRKHKQIELILQEDKNWQDEEKALTAVSEGLFDMRIQQGKINWILYKVGNKIRKKVTSQTQREKEKVF